MINIILLFLLYVNFINSQDINQNIKQFDRESQECCSNCLARPELFGGNDSLSFDKCSLETTTNCCYENNCHMTLITNNFIFSSNIKFENNVPFSKQGEWIQLQWDNIEYITYIFINENQIKEIQPTNTSLLLESSDNFFQFCIENIGSIYFRGWKQNGCIASPEYQINIKENINFDLASSICQNKPKIEIVDNCNLNRASLINGKCECISGFSNPPLCDKDSVWKTLAIVMTSVAAVCSITFISYTCYNKHKQKLSRQPVHFHFNNSDNITHPNSRYNNTGRHVQLNP